MPAAVGVGVLLILLLMTVAFIAVTLYNRVVAMERRADRAWANVDVALKQRYDELPNLVEAVRGQLGFERSVLDDVARARAHYTTDTPLREQAEAAAETSRVVRSLFAVIEHYPELRSQANVMALQTEIQRLETVIARRRELFNEQVYQYNAAIQQLPAVLVAGLFGWQPRPLFDAAAAERRRPEAGVQPS